MTLSQMDIDQFLASVSLSCPTCGKTCAQVAQCRRCKTDLSLLIKTATQSMQLRERARFYLLVGEFSRSLELAQKAQQLHKTSRGHLIERLAMVGLEYSPT